MKTLVRNDIQHFKQKTLGYYDPVKGNYFSLVSKRHAMEDPGSLQEVLTLCDTQVLFFLPTLENKYPNRQNFIDAGARVEYYLDRTPRTQEKMFTARVTFHGKKINCYSINTWFKVTPGSLLQPVILAHRAIQKELEDLFQPREAIKDPNKRRSIPMLATPTQYGSLLLRHSLPYNQKYEPLPEDVLELFREEITIQGRMEVIHHPGKTIQDLHYYDGRWWYASCTRHSPVGPCLHDEVPEVMPYVPGFYRVRVTVPETWGHIGLLPYKQKGAWVYPRTPGQVFTTWASSHEVALAVKHEWGLEVLERILWPETDNLPEPLKAFTDKLVKFRTVIAGKYEDPIKGMMEDAGRTIFLNTLGGLGRFARELEDYTQKAEDIPDNYTWFEKVESGGYKYTTPEPLSALQEMMLQPHWVRDVWGQGRKKEAEAALKVPFEKLVAERTDGVWTEGPVDFEQGPDLGKPGYLREKPLQVRGPFKWPYDTVDYIHMSHKAKGEW